MNTPPPAGGLVSTLAWVIPISGVVLWVLILPSTRSLIRRKAERLTRHTPEPEPVDTASAEPAKSGPRRREEDPEILGFDREVVRAKFARTRPDHTD